MATIKAYTDISQSKKLAEILPLESADMYWSRCTITDFGDGVLKISYAVEPCNISQFRNTNEDIPCWSLASLLNYLRESDFFPDIEANEHSITMNVSYYDEKEARPLAPIHNIKVEADTFVDACYEMILKLNELKRL